MAYDRYDSRRGWRDPRSRFSGDDDRGRRFDRDDRDERGFFERAGDEVASWFGDEDAERRRRTDHRQDQPNDDRRATMSDDEPRYDRQGSAMKAIGVLTGAALREGRMKAAPGR